MKKSAKKRSLTFAALLLAVVCTAFGVSGTYARYITTDSGTGSATAAKWSAVVTGWAGSGSSKTLTLSPVANPYVANDVIAPDSDAVGILTVDLTGTQVSTDLMASLGDVTINGVSVTDVPTHFTSALNVYSFDTTDDAIAAGTATPLATITSDTQKYNIPLNSGKTALETPKLKVALGLHWKHSDTTTGWNDWDTSVGGYGAGTAPTIQAVINMTAQQHVTSDGNPTA